MRSLQLQVVVGKKRKNKTQQKSLTRKELPLPTQVLYTCVSNLVTVYLYVHLEKEQEVNMCNIDNIDMPVR